MKLIPGDLYALKKFSQGVPSGRPEFLFYPTVELIDPTSEFKLPENYIGLYLYEKKETFSTKNKGFTVLCFLFGTDIFFIDKSDFFSAIKNNLISKL